MACMEGILGVQVGHSMWYRKVVTIPWDELGMNDTFAILA